MKLLHDCVRDVMLYIEEHLENHRPIYTSEIQKALSKYSIEDINYTCEKLDEAGFIHSKLFMHNARNVESMTYNGHIFLDTIRDNKVWSETKSLVSKVAGASLPILQQVASNIISRKLGL